MLYRNSVSPVLDYGSLTGITLSILMPIRWNASNGSRQLCASVVYFLLFLTVILMNYELLKLRTLQARRHHHDAPFFIHAFIRSKLFLCFTYSIQARVPSRSTRNFGLFCLSRQYCPSDRRAPLVNLICNETDIFSSKLKL